MKVLVIVLSNRNSIQKDISSSWLIEMLEHSDTGRLSSSRRSNQGDDLSGLDSEGQILHDWEIGTDRVTELDIAELESSDELVRFVSSVVLKENCSRV